MEILRRDKALHRDKGDGTVVDYYIFREYEIHHNVIAPGTTQQWHRHNEIEETILLIDGELEARWREGEEAFVESVAAGDVVRVARSVHTFANVGQKQARFVVFRLLLDGTDKRDLIRTDKILEDE